MHTTVDGTPRALYKLSYPSMNFLRWTYGRWVDANNRVERIMHDAAIPEVDLATAIELMKTLGKPPN